MEAKFSVDTSPFRGRITVGVYCPREYLDLRTHKDH